VHSKKADGKDKNLSLDALHAFEAQIKNEGGSACMAACGVQGLMVLLGSLALISVPMVVVGELGERLLLEDANVNGGTCTTKYDSEWK
jgi:hypothetical protein